MMERLIIRSQIRLSARLASILPLISIFPCIVKPTCIDPCIGGDGCLKEPPKAMRSSITGLGSFSYSWDDPVDVTSVDRYQIDLAFDDNGVACTGKTSGTACSVIFPESGSSITGSCDNAVGSSYLLCWSLQINPITLYATWIDPCNHTSEICNTGTYSGTPAVHYWLRVSVRFLWSPSSQYGLYLLK